MTNKPFVCYLFSAVQPESNHQPFEEVDKLYCQTGVASSGIVT